MPKAPLRNTLVLGRCLAGDSECAVRIGARKGTREVRAKSKPWQSATRRRCAVVPPGCMSCAELGRFAGAGTR